MDVKQRTVRIDTTEDRPLAGAALTEAGYPRPFRQLSMWREPDCRFAAMPYLKIRTIASSNASTSVPTCVELNSVSMTAAPRSPARTSACTSLHRHFVAAAGAVRQDQRHGQRPACERIEHLLFETRCCRPPVARRPPRGDEVREDELSGASRNSAVAARLPLVDRPVSMRFFGSARYFDSMNGTSPRREEGVVRVAPGKL